MQHWISAMRVKRGCLMIAMALVMAAAPAMAQEAADKEAPTELQRQADEKQQELAMALRNPMKQGMNVAAALTCWFDAVGKTPDERIALYEQGLQSLSDLEPLPQSNWRPAETGVTLDLLDELALRGYDDVKCNIVGFKVDGLRQYGVYMRPHDKGPLPLIVYLHGAAYGVPTYSIPWLGDLARKGYAVVAPALRGEDLFAGRVNIGKAYKCEGEIENLKGEPYDVLGIAEATMARDEVKSDKYAILGHSFGGGAGLLAAARTDKVACLISYDAWLVNPFHFYWERLRGGSKYYWESWEAYCEAPVDEQLSGLMERSIVHHADRINTPCLLFIGEYDGPGYHSSHEDLVAQLKAHKKTFEYINVPDGGHNFVLHSNRKPAKVAYKKQMEWLNHYFPPKKPNGKDTPDKAPAAK